MKTLLTIGLLSLILSSPQLIAADKTDSGYQISLVDPLDEPELYCFDLAGHGKSLKLDDPLQTHTCKRRNFGDQTFEFIKGQLKVVGFNRCVEAAGSSQGTLPGSAILARSCSDSANQKLAINDDGTIQFTNTDFCIGAGGNSREASGPSHMWRTLSVIDCTDSNSSLNRWTIELE